MVRILQQEFEHEVINTRRLLEAIPEKDINFKPAPTSWTMGELAQHIASIYYWYTGTLTLTEYDLAAETLQRDAPENITATRAFFEQNVIEARKSLAGISDEDLKTKWTLRAGERKLIDAMPRGAVIRGFLFNHLYHHRGEMIIYLRASGNTVPGLYGPTAEESFQ